MQTQTQQRRLLRNAALHSNWRNGCALCGGSDGRLDLMQSNLDAPEELRPCWQVHRVCFDAAYAKQEGTA
jgi:hypothetical protein